jgi:two-component system capsular synthesis sensor histidine kinase RcsC
MPDDRTEQAWKPASEQTRCGARPSHRILVVDDDASIRQLSAEALVSCGYQADAAEDGAAAWRALNTDSYNLLITDHNMPNVTGLELVRKLRAAHMALPVILATGAMPTEELNRHRWLRIEATLLKPFTLAMLLGTVREVLRATDNDREQNELQPIGRSQPAAHSLRL